MHGMEGIGLNSDIHTTISQHPAYLLYDSIQVGELMEHKTSKYNIERSGLKRQLETITGDKLQGGIPICRRGREHSFPEDLASDGLLGPISLRNQARVGGVARTDVQDTLARKYLNRIKPASKVRIQMRVRRRTNRPGMAVIVSLPLV